MSKKLTQEEVEKRSLVVGIRAVGKYKGCDTKMKFECPNCGKIFLCKPFDIWNKKQQSCGCHRNKLLSDKLKKEEKIGTKFNSWTIIKFSRSIGRKRYYLCKCDCGTIREIRINNLRTGMSKSCGYCDNPQIGDVFGELTIIEVHKSTKHGCRVTAKCTCGRLWKGSFCYLIRGHVTRSCGNCKKFYNGVLTSTISLSLKDLLPSDAEHNYKIGRKSIDWAFTHNNKKIALEYNEWFWHGSIIKYDKHKYDELIKLGWNIICINAHNNIPTQQQIDKALQQIDDGRKKIIIKLPGWGNGPTFKPTKN